MANQSAAYFFIPGNRPERFDKACSAAPGMMIIDLDDAVPPEQKNSNSRTPLVEGLVSSGRCVQTWHIAAAAVPTAAGSHVDRPIADYAGSSPDDW
jgi:hypothetical protein